MEYYRKAVRSLLISKKIASKFQNEDESDLPSPWDRLS
jgi:hypothetical protein